MSMLGATKNLLPQRLAREYSIRWRLWRAARRSAGAERRAAVLLISYPKCGRTWLRMMLSRALANHLGLDDVEYLATDLLGGPRGDVPHVRVSHDDNPHWKSAARLERSKRRYRDKKIILLARDPRDVVVSMYFERSRREQAYDRSLHEFLGESRGSLDTVLAYYNIWAAERRNVGEFCLVRYEDLKADASAQLKRIAEFIGVEIAPADIDEAVEFGSFDNMRAMETGNVLDRGRLRPRDPNDVESFKTRRGKVGGYVDYLKPDEIEWMERKIRETLDPSYGYGTPPAAVATPEGGTA